MNPNVKDVRRGVTILASLLVLHCALHQIHMVTLVALVQRMFSVPKRNVVIFNQFFKKNSDN